MWRGGPDIDSLQTDKPGVTVERRARSNSARVNWEWHLSVAVLITNYEPLKFVEIGWALFPRACFAEALLDYSAGGKQHDCLCAGTSRFLTLS